MLDFSVFENDPEFLEAIKRIMTFTERQQELIDQDEEQIGIRQKGSFTQQLLQGARESKNMPLSPMSKQKLKNKLRASQVSLLKARLSTDKMLQSVNGSRDLRRSNQVS